MRRIAACLFAVLGFALSPLCAAQDIGFYVGGALGQAKLKDWCSGGSGLVACDDKDTAWKILAGYQFHRNFAAEVQYMDLGTVSATGNFPPFGTVGVSADNTSWSASLLGILPLGSAFSLFGKLGIERIDQKSSVGFAGAAGSDKGSDSGVLFGVGAKLALTRSLRLRAEWERGDTLKSEVVSLGAEWRF
jgi:opacity protein-like surface antigen